MSCSECDEDFWDMDGESVYCCTSRGSEEYLGRGSIVVGTEKVSEKFELLLDRSGPSNTARCSKVSGMSMKAALDKRA